MGMLKFASKNVIVLFLHLLIIGTLKCADRY